MKTLKIEIPKGYEIDKEKSTFENIVFKPIDTKYIDLGLPSGTLWAYTNEEGYYSYQEAIDTFGENNLPKLTDFAELYDYCKWEWRDDSKVMLVIGPNGNHIFLPASGYRNNHDGKLHLVGSGLYWSITTNNYHANRLYFDNNDNINLSYNNCAYKFSIRKIKRK